MKSWSLPAIPPTQRSAALSLFDSATGKARPVTGADGVARMYVCGITPYDATHLGHAATYVTFDLVQRALRATGLEVRYAQNVTDVDDPLFERAARDGVDWRDLGRREIQLFRDDMTALRVIPPDAFIGVEESMARHAERVGELIADGTAYTLPVGDDALRPGVQDVYLDLGQQPQFGLLSGWSREQMLEVFADRGGDPDRPGKRDVLDPLLWRGARKGEPFWPGPIEGDEGRPGWHLECTTIALDELGPGFDLQGGGDDLVFPHHEMSAVQAHALPGHPGFAQAYAHQAMVAYDGAKMSKSLGNLVRVSDLRAQGVDPMAVRLVLLAQHYRQGWEYRDGLLVEATERLARWRTALAGADGAVSRDATLVASIGERLADDLDSLGALRAVDAWVAQHPTGADDGSGVSVADGIDALLGVLL